MRRDEIRIGTKIKVAVHNPVGGRGKLNRGDVGSALSTPDIVGFVVAQFDRTGNTRYTVMASQLVRP